MNRKNKFVDEIKRHNMGPQTKEKWFKIKGNNPKWKDSQTQGDGGSSSLIL